MARMHDNEFKIDIELVTDLVKHQCPAWANLPIQFVSSSGTDNALFRLGTDHIIRLPRIEWAPGSLVKNIQKEYLWLPQLAKQLTTPIYEPIFLGQPNNKYPWPWTISKWHEGKNPAFEQNNQYSVLAEDLANFLNTMHQIKIPQGPLSRRNSLQELEQETRKALEQLTKDDGDIQEITLLWEKLVVSSHQEIAAVWIHGDFLPGNILISDDNRLSAVIDFTDVGMGDPACDLIIAWALFNKTSRALFKEKLLNMDEVTWQRGRGWALSIALIMLPYYKTRSPILTALAKRMLHMTLMAE